MLTVAYIELVLLTPTCASMQFSGTSPSGTLVEAVELADHPWFVAVQYHPEFQSKPLKAHPLFAGFVNAAIERKGKSSSDQPAVSDR